MTGASLAKLAGRSTKVIVERADEPMLAFACEKSDNVGCHVRFLFADLVAVRFPPGGRQSAPDRTVSSISYLLLLLRLSGFGRHLAAVHERPLVYIPSYVGHK